jgi:hypothetical protein
MLSSALSGAWRFAVANAGFVFIPRSTPAGQSKWEFNPAVRAGQSRS